MSDFICQSCGMPLYANGMNGTDSCGYTVADYCLYCFQDGGFTSDVTMDEMMKLCANYVGGNQCFALANMRIYFPHLRRWAKKEDTESRYYSSITRVLQYIKTYLHENLSLQQLSEIANISPYHFHRIFQSVIGESLATYVNRMRMEYVAIHLKNTNSSLSELAIQTGYSSEQALSRAFRKYFDLPPKTFKRLFFKESFGKELTPRICVVTSKNIISLSKKLLGNEGWRKLYVYAMMNKLLTNESEHIELIHGNEYIPALSVKEPIKSNKHIIGDSLTKGLYAIFTHQGISSDVLKLHTAIHNYWIPKSKYRLRNCTSYVVYLNKQTVANLHPLAEIYIPLQEK